MVLLTSKQLYSITSKIFVFCAKEFLTQINYLLYRKGLGKGKGEARKKIKGLRFLPFAFSSAFACTLQAVRKVGFPKFRFFRDRHRIFNGFLEIKLYYKKR